MKVSRRHVAVIGILIVATVGLAGTGAFSNMTLERSINLPIADDSNAQLGIAVECEHNDSVVVTTVTNRFDEEVGITIRSGNTKRTISGLAPEETAQRTIPAASAGTEVSVKATAGSVKVELQRDVPESCQ